MRRHCGPTARAMTASETAKAPAKISVPTTIIIMFASVARTPTHYVRKPINRRTVPEKPNEYSRHR
jgi:hypothetical protein